METCIVKYGGSFVISGDEYNVDAFDELVRLANEFTDKQFVFVIGGGKLCRNINSVALPFLKKALGENSKSLGVALDEIGIAVTKINGRKVKSYLEEKLGAHRVFEDIIDYPEVAVKTDKQVIIATGYKPGVSTDYDMMLLAKAYDANKVFKISDFPVVLNVSPLDFDKSKISEYEALPIATWDDILNLVGEVFIPGGNYPLDPPSAVLGRKLAEDNSSFALFIGQKSQLRAMLRDEDFVGTIIKNN